MNNREAGKYDSDINKHPPYCTCKACCKYRRIGRNPKNQRTKLNKREIKRFGKLKNANPVELVKFDSPLDKYRKKYNMNDTFTPTKNSKLLTFFIWLTVIFSIGLFVIGINYIRAGVF